MPTLSPIELFTSRLKLRWMDERDVDAHYAVFSDPEVARYWSSGPWTSLDQSRENTTRYYFSLGYRLNF